MRTEADVRLPCGIPRASVRPFVLAPTAMGKYLKQISRSVYIHQCKNISKCSGLC